MSDFDRRIAGIAASQRMIITLDDVRAAGGTRNHAMRRCDAGRWLRFDHGVYGLAGAQYDWTSRLLVAVKAGGADAVASHLAAARLYGMPGYGAAGPEVSVPRGRNYRRPHVRIHESTDLARCATRTVDGVPVTDPERTLLDLGRYVGHQRLRRNVEWCRRQGLVTWSSLIACLVRHARKGRHGVRRLRRVILEDAHRDEITDSDFELLVLSLILDAGLPEPVVRHEVHDGDRFVGEVDQAYPSLHIAVECDGPHHREDPEVYERDKLKRTDLNLCGWTVLEFSHEQVAARPQVVPRDVRAAIDRARAVLASSGPGLPS
jgi:hypothetical protein